VVEGGRGDRDDRDDRGGRVALALGGFSLKATDAVAVKERTVLGARKREGEASASASASVAKVRYASRLMGRPTLLCQLVWSGDSDSDAEDLEPAAEPGFRFRVVPQRRGLREEAAFRLVGWWC
jgi:hypothetical protein